MRGIGVTNRFAKRREPGKEQRHGEHGQPEKSQRDRDGNAGQSAKNRDEAATTAGIEKDRGRRHNTRMGDCILRAERAADA